MKRLPPVLIGALLVSLVSGSVCADASQGPIAHYTFDEGSGGVLHDRSGNHHDGKIVGAKWASLGGAPVLTFDGSGDYVNLGDNRALKLPGDMTILAWVKLDASPYPNDLTNWTIIDCEQYRQEGFILRIDGASSKVMYRVSRKGRDYCGFGATPLENHKAYLVGMVRSGNVATVYVDGIPEVRFTVEDPEFGAVPLKISSTDQSFNGSIGQVWIYNRALSLDDVAGHYWRDAVRYGKDTSQRGRLRIRPFVYYREKQAIAEVDFFGVLPVGKDEKVRVELAARGGKAVSSRQVESIPETCKGDFTFDLGALSDGEYELRAVLEGPDRTVKARAAFAFPAQPVRVPSPADTTVGPLPVPPPRLPCQIRVTNGGGFVITVKGQSFPVESTFSFPHGGENKLVSATAPDRRGESGWRVAHKRVDSDTWEIRARGQHYVVARRVAVRPGRVIVSDTITNQTGEPIGIILRNRLGTGRSAVGKAYLAGKEAAQPVSDVALKTCPTIFLTCSGVGLGLVALDDVYVVQSRGSFDGRGADLFSKEFALDGGASYTLEWAIYAGAACDYYDFINAVRRDEGRNNVTVDGTLAFVPQTQRRRDIDLVPTREYFRIRNARYATLYCLSWCTDDPTISVEGIEFTEYPKERQRIKAMMAAMARTAPQVKGMFHVAHQLYATSRPAELHPDSRVIRSDGKQAMYPYNYESGTYFSRERYNEGWRWWIYYPTSGNSFGKAMLDSVDVMMDELGCRGVFVDGFLWGYGGEYTYDRWDGHTADIDPQTKTIKRKKGSVILLTQDAMAAYCKKVWSKGGVVVANNTIVTRTIGRLPLIIDKEVSEGPSVHLAQTPITLGNPAAIRSEADVYRDVQSKLRWGNLYFYYGEPATLTYESVPKQMYPITVQEIHSGTVKGKERLITMHGGVYGWPGCRCLHRAYRYDSRGHRVRPGFVTTVDASSVRTQIDLDKDEMAVLVRIPVRLESSSPVNVIVERYDERDLVMAVNGKGAVKAIMPNGASHAFELGGQRRINLKRDSARR